MRCAPNRHLGALGTKLDEVAAADAGSAAPHRVLRVAPSVSYGPPTLLRTEQATLTRKKATCTKVRAGDVTLHSNILLTSEVPF